MQYSTKRRVVLGVTTGGLLISGFGMAAAQAAVGATAEGSTSDSPGLLSGNLVSVPINLPVNVCGDSINVVGVLNPAAGNACRHGSPGGGAGAAAAGSASDSPGALSGNLISVPISAPVNACGDSVNVVGIGNPASHNACADTGGTGASSGGSAHGSPGLGSGNLITVPISAPINACGDSVSLLGIGNAAAGDSCGTPSAPPTHPAPPPSHPAPPCPPGSMAPPTPPAPPVRHPAPPCPPGHMVPPGPPAHAAPPCPPPHAVTPPRHAAPPVPTGTLAETGSDAALLAPFGVGLLGAGAGLRRKLPTRG
jgi:ChpA-C